MRVVLALHENNLTFMEVRLFYTFYSIIAYGENR